MSSRQRKITQLIELTSLASDDVFAVVDVSTNITKKIKASNMVVGSSGLAFETPSGTVNDSNVTFVATVTPTFLIINGVIYFENLGYTLSGLTITLGFPVGTGGWIKSAS